MVQSTRTQFFHLPIKGTYKKRVTLMYTNFPNFEMLYLFQFLSSREIYNEHMLEAISILANHKIPDFWPPPLIILYSFHFFF